jgi:hypothetical protein
LSSQVIATHGKGAQFARKVDRVVLNAMVRQLPDGFAA